MAQQGNPRPGISSIFSETVGRKQSLSSVSRTVLVQIIRKRLQKLDTLFDFPMFKPLSYAIKSLKDGMVLDYFPC